MERQTQNISAGNSLLNIYGDSIFTIAATIWIVAMIITIAAIFLKNSSRLNMLLKFGIVISLTNPILLILVSVFVIKATSIIFGGVSIFVMLLFSPTYLFQIRDLFNSEIEYSKNNPLFLLISIFFSGVGHILYLKIWLL